MSEPEIYRLLVWTLFGLAAAAFLYLLWRPAPYGRHYQGSGWGPTVSGKAGWIGMEWPAVFLFLFVYLQGSAALSLVPLVFLAIWQIHYLNRTLIYPFRIRTGQRMPLVAAGSGFFFNVLNAYVNARFVSHLGEYEDCWLSEPCFLIGLAVFAGGMFLNAHSDNILLSLRINEGQDMSFPIAAPSGTSPARTTSERCWNRRAGRSRRGHSACWRSVSLLSPTWFPGLVATTTGTENDFRTTLLTAAPSSRACSEEGEYRRSERHITGLLVRRL